ncbi:MAG: roadblock/LC7 domain-containing protein [Candidatus Korarchaeota archaeon]
MISQKQFRETFEKLAAQPGVKGVVIATTEGLPISSNLGVEATEAISAHITSLVGKARSVSEGLGYSKDGLKFILLDLGVDEVLVTPANEYMLIVVRSKQ